MKITSKEISEKTFEKNFRGYDKDEVTAFLNVLSGEWDRIMAEKADLEKRLVSTEKEANKLKQVEESLFRTLKTAEDTGASIIEEANNAAEDIMNEAHQNAGSMLNEAQTQSKNLIESAEAKGREIMENLKSEVNSLVSGFEILMKHRDLLIKNLKSLTEGIDDTITVSEESLKKVNIQAHSNLVEELSKANAFSMANILEYQKEEEMVSKTFDGENLEAGNPVDSDTDSEDDIEENEMEFAEKEIGSSKEVVEDKSEREVEIEKDAEEQKEEPKSKLNKGGSFFDQLD
ncbi:DivIVA domain-containing protein [Aquiflexum sp.]|uniref:DivIVA domain-containing protein n=1 Tax=Aquiflexum sp. TaxID=1872584 RepID=UPI0035936FCB